jgi:hypothetical protein
MMVLVVDISSRDGSESRSVVGVVVPINRYYRSTTASTSDAKLRIGSGHWASTRSGLVVGVVLRVARGSGGAKSYCRSSQLSG